MSQEKYRVGILGATGTVGQRFIQLLAQHPLFEVTALAASERSQARCYADACSWRLPDEMPAFAKPLVVQPPEPPLDCEIIFSSLPASLAREAEEKFARAGYPVISNSSAFRMDPFVPLLIPEVNPEHLHLLEAQQKSRRFGEGFVLTNPNCSTVVLALALAPLHSRFGIASVAVTTIQAISGAGYPGVASLDICDNILPFIAEEEEKMERETQKILGRVTASGVESDPMAVSAQCHRANVTDGHMVAVRVKLNRKAAIEEIRHAFASFHGVPQELRLPSAPEHPLILREEPDRPQPRLDRDAGGGMSVTVGRLRADRVLDYRFVALGHNTIRGAAGAAILNAELLHAKGMLRPRAAQAAVTESSRV